MADEKVNAAATAAPQANESKKAKETTAIPSDFDVLGVERRGDKFALIVRGEIVVDPTDKDRERFLNTEVGSRIKLDVKLDK